MTARRALALIVLAAGIASALEGALSPAAGQERKDPRRSERPGKPRRSPAEPGRSALSPEASLLIQQAEQYRRLGQCDRAIPLLEELVARHPQIAVAPEMLSSCYLETGRPADAAGLLERMLAAEPERLAYIRDLGTAYLDLGRRADAIATWRRALDIGEENGPLYGVVAKLEQEAGLYDEAIATYREGSAHAAFLEQYSNEIVRLERVLGRPENALRELLRAMDRREASIDAELRTAVAIYRDAKSRDGLAALVDSAAAAGGGRAGAFRALRMAYLIEEGRAGEARAELLGAGAPEPSERELRAILMHVARARGAGRIPGTASSSPPWRGAFSIGTRPRRTPRRSCSCSRRACARARRRSTGAARAAALDDALSLAATARDHALGAPYRERASAIRAEILFEDLRRSDDALRELARIPERAFARSLGAKELRMRALLASADRDAAARALSGLAADPDSNAARIGEYGLAALAFRRGAYEAAVKSFSRSRRKAFREPVGERRPRGGARDPRRAPGGRGAARSLPGRGRRGRAGRAPRRPIPSRPSSAGIRSRSSCRAPSSCARRSRRRRAGRQGAGGFRARGGEISGARAPPRAPSRGSPRSSRSRTPARRSRSTARLWNAIRSTPSWSGFANGTWRSARSKGEEAAPGKGSK